MLTVLKRALTRMLEAERAYRIGSARQQVMDAIVALEDARQYAEHVSKRDACHAQPLVPSTLPPEFQVVWGYSSIFDAWEKCWFCWTEDGPRWVSHEDGGEVAVSCWAPLPAIPESTTN